MIREIVNTNRLFYWPAEGDRPALVSDGHWVVRYDVARGFGGIAPDPDKPWRWENDAASNNDIPSVAAVWNGEALHPIGRLPVKLTACDWRKHTKERASALPAGAIRVGKRLGWYIAYGPTCLVLASDDGTVRVGIDPVYYSAALDLGFDLWAAPQAATALARIQLRRNGEVVGLVAAMRLP